MEKENEQEKKIKCKRCRRCKAQIRFGKKWMVRDETIEWNCINCGSHYKMKIEVTEEGRITPILKEVSVK